MEHFPAPLTRVDSDLLVDRIEVQHAEHDGLAPVGGFAQQLTDEVAADAAVLVGRLELDAGQVDLGGASR
ncbi:hypothetical protein [Micromonospora inositola]|nr:hypothetical protein [Micromonospora inositola]